MLSAVSSTTLPPAMRTALVVSSCAHLAPLPLGEALMTATALSLTAPTPYGREIQSMAFFRTAGMVPLYSGVTSRNASASLAAARSASTAGMEVDRGPFS